MIREELEKRRLPELLTMINGERVSTGEQWKKRRGEILDLLCREEYGYTPAAPARVEAAIGETVDPAYAGKAIQQQIQLSFETPGGPFAFPFTLIVPKASGPVPVFLYLAFRSWMPDRYLPAEEILDHGFALACLCYEDVTTDGEAQDGVAALYPRDEKTGCGKIGLWAFAASRVMDYLVTRDDLDPARVCVSGHSRLGKTALWCAAQDERFSMAVSNDSGCSGAALSRGAIGENVGAITRSFPYWFCGKYACWAGKQDQMPMDQHMLLALIAPRGLFVSSAQEDEWADPRSEFLGSFAAGEAWEVCGCPGLVSPEAWPEVNVPLMDGMVGYQMRSGTHFHSREDWNAQMAYREKHQV